MIKMVGAGWSWKRVASKRPYVYIKKMTIYNSVFEFREPMQNTFHDLYLHTNGLQVAEAVPAAISPLSPQLPVRL